MKPWSPLKAGLITGGCVLVLGVVLSLVVFLVIQPGGDAFARGQKLGQGLASLSLFAGLLAGAIQYTRNKKRDKHPVQHP